MTFEKMLWVRIVEKGLNNGVGIVSFNLGEFRWKMNLWSEDIGRSEQDKRVQ